MSSVTMFQRHTIADAFTRIGDEPTTKALDAAQKTIGTDAWKAGFSAEKAKIVRSALKECGASFETALPGRLEDVNHVQTHAGGSTFDKLRVTLARENGDKIILSGDMRSEFSQRLLAKLDAAVQQGKTSQVTIGGFAEPVSRDGKSFVNHVATLKDSQGQEIKAAPGHFSKAAEHGQAAVDALERAGIRNPKLVKESRNAARDEYFTKLACEIHARLSKDRKIEPIEKLGQVTGRFVSASESTPERSHVVIRRAGVDLTVDMPRQALSENIEPGTPLRVRYNQKDGCSVEVGQSQSRGKGLGV